MKARVTTKEIEMKSEEIKSQAKKLDLGIQLMEHELGEDIKEQGDGIGFQSLREELGEKKAQLSKLNELVGKIEESLKVEKEKKERDTKLELGRPVIEKIKSLLDVKEINLEIKIDEDYNYIELTTKVATVILEPSYFASNAGSWHRYNVKKPRIELKLQSYDERTRYYTSMDVESTSKKIVKVIEKQFEKLAYEEKREVDEKSCEKRLVKLAIEWFGDKANLDSDSYISGIGRGEYSKYISRPIIKVETKRYRDKIHIYNVDEEKGTATLKIEGTVTIEQAKRLALECSDIWNEES